MSLLDRQFIAPAPTGPVHEHALFVEDVDSEGRVAVRRAVEGCPACGAGVDVV